MKIVSLWCFYVLCNTNVECFNQKKKTKKKHKIIKKKKKKHKIPVKNDAEKCGNQFDLKICITNSIDNIEQNME